MTDEITPARNARTLRYIKSIGLNPVEIMEDGANPYSYIEWLKEGGEKVWKEWPPEFDWNKFMELNALDREDDHAAWRPGSFPDFTATHKEQRDTSKFLKTDSKGRASLGVPEEHYLRTEREDGSIVFTPATPPEVAEEIVYPEVHFVLGVFGAKIDGEQNLHELRPGTVSHNVSSDQAKRFIDSTYEDFPVFTVIRRGGSKTDQEQHLKTAKKYRIREA